MYELLTRHIKNAAYLQWEEIGFGSALEHWHCVEDIVCFAERKGLLSEEALLTVLKNTRADLSYEDFVREVAYRISFCSGAKDAESIWFSSEKLLRNSEWRYTITQAAELYSQNKGSAEFINQIHSARVRDYYKNL